MRGAVLAAVCVLAVMTVVLFVPVRSCPFCAGDGVRVHINGKYPGPHLCSWCDSTGRMSLATRWSFRESSALR